MYHSVAADEQTAWIDPSNHLSPQVFERQVHFLATQRRVISLTELIQYLRDRKSCPLGSIVITFDDGYLDNLTVAAPILGKYKLPATLFLPTGQIDRGETQWIDEIYSCFRFRTRDVLINQGAGTQSFDLRNPVQYEDAYRKLCQTLLTSGYASRRQLLDALHEQLRPSQQPPRLTMTWEDVRLLLAQYPGFEIGGHTVDHTDMSQLTRDQALQELTTCRQRIHQMTGAAPMHFSFPYGRTSPMLQKVVADALFESACGGGSDPVICGEADCFELRRIAAPSTNDHFGFLTSTLNSGLLHRIVR
jgi:peptidoglycan/xylan/chitin deacetylase (PgdA/CDA1 family)